MNGCRVERCSVLTCLEIAERYEQRKTSFGQSDIVRLSDEDAAIELLERAVTGLWDVVNELTRFRRTTRQNYRVTVFGSARLKRATPVYNGVKKLAAELTKMGCDIISGDGPGLMQAANEGAHSVHRALKRSVGIRIALPFEQEINPFVGRAYEHPKHVARLVGTSKITTALFVEENRIVEFRREPRQGTGEKSEAHA